MEPIRLDWGREFQGMGHDKPLLKLRGMGGWRNPSNQELGNGVNPGSKRSRPKGFDVLHLGEGRVHKSFMGG